MNIIPPIWKLSSRWAITEISCIPSEIEKGCFGRCCWHPKFWPCRTGENGRCPFLEWGVGCKLSPEEKPVLCHLFPLTLNKGGTLVLSNGVYWKGHCCFPNSRKGLPIIVAIKDNISTLFGEKLTRGIIQSVYSRNDPWIAVPDNIRSSYQREREREALNLPPIPRNGIHE